MRFRFVIDHRQLVAMIAGVLLLGLLSFLGGLSVGLLLQPQLVPAAEQTVVGPLPEDPEPERETAVGPVAISTVGPDWASDVAAPGTGAEGGLEALDESRAGNLVRGSDPTLSDPRGAVAGPRGEERRPPAAQGPLPDPGEGGWQPRSAFWRAFDRHLDPETELDPYARGERRGAPNRLRLSFVEGQAVPRVRHGEDLYRVARDHDLNPALMAAMARVESGYDLRAVSPRGALGLMQVTPDTARRFGIDPDLLFEAEANLVAAARYLVWLRERFDDDPVLVLAAYNAGEAAVDLYGGVPDYPETRDYVAKVLDLLGVRR